MSSIITGKITNLGVSVSQIAAANKGYYIYPTKFGLSDITGALDPTRTEGNTEFYNAEISSRNIVDYKSIEFICTIPSGATAAIKTIRELYIYIKDQHNVDYLFAIGHPTVTLQYNPNTKLRLKMLIVIDNVNAASTYQFIYTDAHEVEDHNLDPTAHPDIQKAISKAGIFVNDSTFNYTGQSWEEAREYDTSVTDGMVVYNKALDEKYYPAIVDGTEKEDALGIASFVPGKNEFETTDIDLTEDTIVVSPGLFPMLVTAYKCRFTTTNTLPDGLKPCAEVSSVTRNQGSSLSGGEYFTFSSTTIDYYLWYTVDAVGVDPAIVGKTAIPVILLSTDTASVVAGKIAVAINALAAFTSAALVNVITITNSVSGQVTDIADGTLPLNTGFTFAVTTSGVDTNQIFYIIKTDLIERSEITNVTCNAANTMVSGEYFTLSSMTTDYYVWFNIDGLGGDPSPAGKTGIEVACVSTDSSGFGDTADELAVLTASAINAKLDFGSVALGPVVTVVNAAIGNVTDSADFNTGFIVTVTQHGFGGLADDNKIKIAVSASDASAGTAIDIIDSGVGTHTIWTALGKDKVITKGFIRVLDVIADNTDIYLSGATAGSYTVTPTAVRIGRHLTDGLILVDIYFFKGMPDRNVRTVDSVYTVPADYSASVVDHFEVGLNGTLDVETGAHFLVMSDSITIPNVRDLMYKHPNPYTNERSTESRLKDILTKGDFFDKDLVENGIIADTRQAPVLLPQMSMNEKSVDYDLTIPSVKGAMSVGPITVETGYTVTVIGDWSII